MKARKIIGKGKWVLPLALLLCSSSMNNVDGDEVSPAFFQGQNSDSLFANPQSAFRQVSYDGCNCQPYGQCPTSPSQMPSTSPYTSPSPYSQSTPGQSPSPAQSPSFNAPFSLASSGGLVPSASSVAASSAGGYLDIAAPVTMFRLRYDAAYGNNVPDRAEYFYPKCGCFRVLGLDPEAEGPPEIETNVDYQDIRPYFEYAANDNFSVFVEMALRSLNPEQNDNTTGFGDMNTGFKYALLADPDEYFTFQFRAYVPTGDGDRGLGTEHVSLEPGLLYFNRLTSRTILQAELQYWIPLGGSDFAGDIIRYGVGLGYTVHESCDMTVTPIAEFVGWSILDGQEFNGNTGMVSDSGGTTIVNGKFGVRIGLGNDGGQSALGRNNSVYIGYGRALTNEVWYEDILRLEYRLLY